MEPELDGSSHRDSALGGWGGGFGIMRDAQMANPRSVVTGDGWFVYNLAANLARM